MDRDRNILKPAALTPQHVAGQAGPETMPQTTQQLAALCLRQAPERLLSKADKRHLFGMESWPENLPIKTKDVLRTLKIYHRIREVMGL